MSLESDIQVLLSGITAATGGAFHDTANQNTSAPYIVWSLISKTQNNTFQGASVLQQVRVQVDSYGKTQAERKTLDDAIAIAFAGSSLVNIKLMTQHLFEADVRLFRAQSDFSVWSSG